MKYSYLSDEEFETELRAKLDPLVESDLVMELFERFSTLLDVIETDYIYKGDGNEH